MENEKKIDVETKDGTKIENVDQNMKNTLEKVEDDLFWIDPRQSRDVRVLGFNWFNEDKTYRRFALKYQNVIESISEPLNILVGNTAGGAIAFYSDTNILKIKVKLSHKFLMSHMAYTGQAGFDLYIGSEPSDLKFYRSSTFNFKNDEYEFTFFSNLSGGHLLVLNFPLYASVSEVLIGINKKASVLPAHNYQDKGKIVFYGTSITQGGCASRPGMAYPAIVGRKLGYECLNFGFSGNGFGEKEIAQLLAQIENVKLFVLDYEGNASGPDLKLEKTLVTFIEQLRTFNPTVPILVLSKITTCFDAFYEEGAQLKKRLNEFQRKTVAKFHKNDPYIYFYDGGELLKDIGFEGTVDGVHPNDLGFYEMARKLTPVIKFILDKQKG
jgi:lysophospholipase L1-like esterase